MTIRRQIQSQSTISDHVTVACDEENKTRTVAMLKGRLPAAANVTGVPSSLPSVLEAAVAWAIDIWKMERMAAA